jgi:hypothetical protein
MSGPHLTSLHTKRGSLAIRLRPLGFVPHVYRTPEGSRHLDLAARSGLFLPAAATHHELLTLLHTRRPCVAAHPASEHLQHPAPPLSHSSLGRSAKSDKLTTQPARFSESRHRSPHVGSPRKKRESRKSSAEETNRAHSLAGPSAICAIDGDRACEPGRRVGGAEARRTRRPSSWSTRRRGWTPSNHNSGVSFSVTARSHCDFRRPGGDPRLPSWPGMCLSPWMRITQRKGVALALTCYPPPPPPPAPPEKVPGPGPSTGPRPGDLHRPVRRGGRPQSAQRV